MFSGAKRFVQQSALVVAGVFGIAHAVPAIDAPPLILEHLTTADGLPQGTVLNTLQDSQGFIWLGTEDGLVRYDGHDLVRYAYSRNAPSGLPGNFIYQTAEDPRHDLWIAMKDSGVARWQRTSDTFKTYRHVAGDASSLASDGVRSLVVDGRGRVWIGTSNAGVDVLETASGALRHLRHTANESASLADDRVLTLTVDRAGDVWVGTENGLDRWNEANHGFVHYRHDPSDPLTLSGNQISRILEGADGTLWIGTFDGGLDHMDRSGRLIRAFRHDSANAAASLASDDVRTVLEDQAGHLWVGTAEGLDLLERQTNEFHHYRQDPMDGESLRDSYIMSLYQDTAGLVWIGTRSGGVSRWNPRSWELGGHRPHWLDGKLVTAFADAEPGKVWVSSLGGGLVLFDTVTGKATDIDSILGRADAIGDKRVMALRRDRDGNLWIGTMTHGLLELTAGKSLIRIPVQVGEAHSTSSSGIMTIFQSHDGAIWVGTHGGGANIVNPRTRLVKQLPHDESQAGAVSFANVSAFAEDSHGHMWIGTDGGGLDLAKTDGSVIRAFRHDHRDRRSLPANTVWSLEVDAKDRVWIGTDGGGLAQVVGRTDDPDSIHFQVMSREEGLPSDTVYGVLADATDNIWLSSNAGLLRFNPDTGALKTYHRQHGLQGEEYDSGAYLRLADGRICFGGPGGFNIIDPAQITQAHGSPRVILTGLSVMGVPQPTVKPTWLLEQLSLDFRANIVTLDFGVLDFTSPKRNRIAYRMAGLTESWIDVGTQQRITLTNLDAGKHTLEVRAANADSIWSEEPLRIQLQRDPAPWRSNWAYAAYLLAACALVAYRVRLQREKFRRVVRQQQRLESEVALRTRELSESNSQLAEAVQAKSRFMDRMSHELRTPMNGVLGMTELLGRTKLSDDQATITQTIRSSGRVLLQIVDDLLDLSKINAGKITLEELPVSLLELMEESASLFAGSVAEKRVEIIVCPPSADRDDLVGDPLRLRQILMNLIGNAVKFTARGEIVIRADFEQETVGTVVMHLSVSDTGIGMDAQTMGKIFTPFTQADESTSRRFGGSGLGLTICRELAQLMGGTITVQSEVDRGSTFAVRVPLKVGSNSASATTPGPRRLVRVFTHQSSLEECLSRHVAALGHDRTNDRTIGAADEIHIVDSPYLQTYERDRRLGVFSTDARLIVTLTESELESKSCGPISGLHAVALKPIRRRTLQHAIDLVTGADPSSTKESSLLTTETAVLGAHVLLVEDDRVNAAVAQGYLSALGCTCVWVNSGADAIARVAIEAFDLILMDLSMPKLDGFGTCSVIRSHQRDGRRVPIVALTAHSSTDYRQTVLQADMDDILTKPCTLEQCEAMLRRWIDVSRLQPARPKLAAGGWIEIDQVAVARLKKLRGSAQPDLFLRLVDMFESGSHEEMALLQTALQSADFGAAAASCHKFASSAANVGASAFSRGIRELELLCKQSDVTRSHELYGRLRAALPILLEELRRESLPVSA